MWKSGVNIVLVIKMLAEKINRSIPDRMEVDIRAMFLTSILIFFMLFASLLKKVHNICYKL